ncbi:hypothetical protein [Desulfotomaculum sp. 1211_IL3151]|uniref:hypothetical protein n=1 Tax=Desulfotomaculum sp. 1211_IL3151 TaxID=3084055 RepID=UPI002FDA8517
MSGWLNLLKKEYRMTKTSAFVLLGMLIIAGLWGVYSNREHWGIIFAPASLLLIFAVFYPAFYMLKSVHSELKHTPHLWLHCPQPAWKLLSAKLTTAVAVMLAILAVGAVFVYITILNTHERIGIPAGDLALLATEVGAYLTVIVVGASIYMAVWGSLIAIAIASTRNVLGRYNWLAGIGTFFVATWGMDALYESWVYQTLTQWGSLKINILSLNKVLPSTVNNHFEGINIYAGEMLGILLVTVIVFALSAWLIDNKVEV